MKRLVPLFLLLAIFSSGVWMRIEALHSFNGTVSADTPAMVTMAENLRYGLGLYDPVHVGEFRAGPAAYRAHPCEDPTRLRRSFYTDYGLSLIYAAAIRLFGNCGSPPLLLLWLQVLIDSLNVLLMAWVGYRLGGIGVSLCAAALYAGYQPLVTLVGTHPYYYYWACSFALWNVAFMAVMLDDRFAERPLASRLGWAAVYGAFLGLSGMVRAIFYFMGFACAAGLVLRWRRYWRSMAAVASVVVAVQWIVMAPVMRISYTYFGSLRPPRSVWHSAYVGFGAHPNPYGIRFSDDCGFDFARAHGLLPDDPAFERKYEAMMRHEVLRIRREHPWLWPRNVALNVADGLTSSLCANAFRWSAGRFSLGFALPVGQLPRALFLIAGVVCGMALLRAAPRWLFGVLVLQGLYFVVGVGVFIPPFDAYNSSYDPTFLVTCALPLAVCAAASLRVARGKGGVWLAAAPAIALAAGAILFTMPEPTAIYDVLAGPLVTCLVMRVVGRWLDPRAGRVAGALFLVLLAIAVLLSGQHMPGQFGRLGWAGDSGGLLVGLACVNLVQIGTTSTLALAVMALIASGLHPEVLMLPLTAMSLIHPLPPPVRRKAVRVAAILALAGGTVGLLPLHPSLTVLTVPLVCLPILLLCRPGLPPPARTLCGLLAAALPLVSVAHFVAWPACALLLLVSWLGWRVRS